MFKRACALALAAAVLAVGCAASTNESSSTSTSSTSTSTDAGTAAKAAPTGQADAGAAPHVHKLPSGLQYEEVVVGSGKMAETGMTVSVHYTGRLTDGTKFDSSLDRGTPLVWQLGDGQMIRGMDEGVMGMRIGGKRKLTIPPDIGYGAAGRAPQIPPNATLLFDVELLDVK